jgi:hypothetical protein
MKTKRGGKRVPGEQPMYHILLKHSQNKICGLSEVGHEYNKLKLEVALGASWFWRKRGMSDPGTLAFR